MARPNIVLDPNPDHLSEAIHGLAEEDLGKALAHLATIEQGFDRDTYNLRYARNKGSIDRLLGLCNGGEFFARARFGSVRATDMREPAIHDLSMHPHDEQLLIGSFTTDIGVNGEVTTHRGGLVVSAAGYASAITSSNVSYEAIEMMRADPSATAYFAGNEAVGALSSLVGANVIEMLLSRPPLPIPPRAA